LGDLYYRTHLNPSRASHSHRGVTKARRQDGELGPMRGKTRWLAGELYLLHSRCLFFHTAGVGTQRAPHSATELR
jgi:hypothetical protein